MKYVSFPFYFHFFLGSPVKFVTAIFSIRLTVLLLHYRYDVMQRCWFANTDYRPTFSELKNELSELLSVASDNLYIRNVTQELPYTYYLNEEYLLLPKQFVCENAYVKLMSDEAGYMNDGFDRRYSEAMTSRKLSTGQGGIPASKINASTAF